MSREIRYYLKNHFLLNPYENGLKTLYLFTHESPFSNFKRLISTYLKHDVNATFFIVGAALKENLEKIDLIKSYGFDIAPHGYIHINYMDHPNPKMDMEHAINIFKKAGISVKGFRPPEFLINHERFEKKTGTSLYKIASNLGLRYLSSTFTGIDEEIKPKKFGVKEFTCEWSDHCLCNDYFKNLSNQQVYANILPHIKNGKVLLFHGQFSGVKNRIRVLENVLNIPEMNFISIEDYLNGKQGTILTTDVGSFSRFNLLKRVLCS